jgi:hypothetical protein
MKTAEEIQREREGQFITITHLLNTADGEVLMKILEDDFYHCPIMGKTSEETAFNCGRREVVAMLRDIKRGNDGR